MSFHLKLLASLPADTDTIEVRNPNTAVKITGQLVDRAGANLSNPFVVSDAGGGADMVFEVPVGIPYDAYWVEGNDVIGRVQKEPLLLASQAEAEGWIDNIKAMTSLRVIQSIVKWAATAASIFSGVVSGYFEDSETITITAGAGSLNHSTAKSIVKFAMVAATTITISGWTQGKPLTLRFSNATPDILTLTDGTFSLVSGTDFDLNGAAGEDEWLTLDHEASRLAVVGQGVVSVLSV